ncbi:MULTISPECIES: hypothetical protein [unclassified Pseudonocardia]|uniref:hypothetical protein n=1 Tax=unclassified Pseudonocardia TaxID=2619320 RepID=UPI0009EB1C2D|nr:MULTISPECIES: hypothetical protein [unclassified Pseudonocardia]
MRASEERAAVQLRDDRLLLAQFARQLRRCAVQDTYAGLHGQDVGLAMAAVFDSLSVTLDQVPGQVRRDALAAARCEHTGPDGPNDPRGRTREGLTSGFGH